MQTAIGIEFTSLSNDINLVFMSKATFFRHFNLLKGQVC